MTEARDPLPPPFVTTAWLAGRLGDPDIQIIDGSWYLPTQGRNARKEYEAGHLPGAIFFDIDAVADHSSRLPHMLPDEGSFGKQVGALGIASDKTLVVYDGAGLFSAPRVWWTLRLFGAKDVRILDGGLPSWRAEGLALETGVPEIAPATFVSSITSGLVADIGAVREALASAEAQVVDARPAPRFRGEAPEPRPGLRSGHMPGSVNLPATDIVSDGRLIAPSALATSFELAGIDLDKPVIASCGSGVSAAVVVLAMAIIGKTDVALYDGSWADYGSRNDLPVATGTS